MELTVRTLGRLRTSRGFQSAHHYQKRGSGWCAFLNIGVAEVDAEKYALHSEKGWHPHGGRVCW
jgi:hypothetical protein